MHRDTTEQLVGLGLIILFGAALILWPPFGDLVDRFAVSYVRDFLQILRSLAR